MEKCWECGNEVELETEYIHPVTYSRASYEKIIKLEEKLKLQEETGKSYSRQYCAKCKVIHDKKVKDMFNEHLELKYKVMFERALQTIERSRSVFISDIKDEIEAVYQFTMSKKKFESQHEIIAAIMILRDRYKFKVQYPIKSFNVDFYIPDLKVILEIDGYMHEHSLEQDKARDEKIRKELGYDHEVIRVPTELIEQNPAALMRAIEALYKEQQRLRKQYDGLLPDNFSKREKAFYSKRFKHLNKS